jgi:hypothetical protein
MKTCFACGSMVLFSFSQKKSQGDFFCEKDLGIFALPEAKPAFGSGTRPEQVTPRNLC